MLCKVKAADKHIAMQITNFQNTDIYVCVCIQIPKRTLKDIQLRYSVCLSHKPTEEVPKPVLTRRFDSTSTKQVWGEEPPYLTQMHSSHTCPPRAI